MVYHFKAQTSARHGASTDANIYIVLHGKIGTSPEVHTNPHIRGNSFEFGNLDEFEIEFPEDYGDIQKIQVRTDMRHQCPDWYCEYIEVRRDKSDVVSRFDVDRWIEDKKRPYMFSIEDKKPAL